MLIRVFAFGDSITNGSWDAEGGWAVRLRNYFYEKENKEADFSVGMYILGIAGETSSGLLERFQQEAKRRIRKEDEEVVFIFLIGTNDLAYLVNENRFNVDKDQYGRNIKKLVQQAKGFGGRIIFLTIPPIVEEIAVKRPGRVTSRILKYVDEYNQVLIRVVKEEGVELVDIYNELIKKRIEGGVYW